MADTDEESVAFAREAEQASGAIESRSAALSTRLQSLGYAPEQHALQEFTDHFAAYRKLDHDVLDLAVQNTNLKAQRLSFGPVRETADGFRDALQAAAQLAPSKDRCRVDALVARAELAVREIQILQAPHIAEPDEAAMTKIESQMTERLAAAREALKSLGANASAAMARQLDTERGARPLRQALGRARRTLAPQQQRSLARAGASPRAAAGGRLRRKPGDPPGGAGERGVQRDAIAPILPGSTRIVSICNPHCPRSLCFAMPGAA